MFGQKACQATVIKNNVKKDLMPDHLTYFPRIKNAIFFEFILTAKPTSNIRLLQFSADSILVRGNYGFKMDTLGKGKS